MSPPRDQSLEQGAWLAPAEDPDRAIEKGPFGPALGYRKHRVKVIRV